MFKKIAAMSVFLWGCFGWYTGCGDPTPTSTEKNADGGIKETLIDQTPGPDQTTHQERHLSETSQADGGITDASTTPEAGPEKALPEEPTILRNPKFSELKPGQWNMIKAPKEAQTICSRGSEYAFFVRPGTVNKIVIDFEGGGACWNAQTCSIADALFKDSIDNLRKLIKTGYAQGIYDKTNPKNPFKDWHHVFIPYCTGDIHWGNNTMTYKAKDGKEIVIHHKGAVNARAVLKWTFANITAPEKVFVTGCSAGAYGSIIWSAYVAKQYKNAKIYQMGDSGVGVITDNFLRDSFPSWKAEDAAPAWIDGLDPAKVKITDHDLAYMYIKIAAHYSSHLFSQYNSAFDKTQVFFFQAMGGGKNPQQWATKMREQIKKISDSTPNFRSFIAPGNKHCIIPYNEFYTYETDGVKLVDWVHDMIHDKPIQSHACVGAACNPPKP